jgi:hypothetical protein
MTWMRTVPSKLAIVTTTATTTIFAAATNTAFEAMTYSLLLYRQRLPPRSGSLRSAHLRNVLDEATEQRRL